MRRTIAAPVIASEAGISLVPFQANWIPMAWEWLHEAPQFNFDDYGPKTLEEFYADLMRRVQSGQSIIGIVRSGEPVGMVGFHGVTPRLGHFAGLCITRTARHQGVGTQALGMLIKSFWAEGLEKIEAMFFSDNVIAEALFRKLGAHDEGILREHALRGGRTVDVKLMGFCRSRGF